MKIFYEGDDFSPVKPVITIGMFDGVHLGHRYLVDAVIRMARQAGGESVVLTFEPHPRLLLSKGNEDLRFLTSLDEKIELLESAGVDNLLVMPFTEELSRTSACDFVEKVLVEKLSIHHLVIGFDHHFGYKGLGNRETIMECAGRFGFGVDRLDPVVDNDVTISSTTIRNWLTSGKLSDANSLLGYDYFLKGNVVKGRKIGSSMGYPTANLKPSYRYKLVPMDGVYAVEVTVKGSTYKAMLYIGTRPTYEEWGGETSIEVNIFDFEGDLYGETLKIIFRHRLRGDIKFENTELLYRQIEIDKEETLRLMS